MKRIGTVSISRFRDNPGMENIDFQPEVDLPTGTFELYSNLGEKIESLELAAWDYVDPKDQLDRELPDNIGSTASARAHFRNGLLTAIVDQDVIIGLAVKAERQRCAQLARQWANARTEASGSALRAFSRAIEEGVEVDGRPSDYHHANPVQQPAAVVWQEHYMVVGKKGGWIDADKYLYDVTADWNRRILYTAPVPAAGVQPITCQIYGHVVGHCGECNVGDEAAQDAADTNKVLADHYLRETAAGVQGDSDLVKRLTHERDALGQAITDAALKAGMYNGEVDLTGPHLIMFAQHLGEAAQWRPDSGRDAALVERVGFEAWAELTIHQQRGERHDITGWYYFDDDTNIRWEAWQARAAHPAPSSDAEPVKPTASEVLEFARKRGFGYTLEAHQICGLVDDVLAHIAAHPANGAQADAQEEINALLDRADAEDATRYPDGEQVCLRAVNQNGCQKDK